VSTGTTTKTIHVYNEDYEKLNNQFKKQATPAPSGEAWKCAKHAYQKGL